ncbi:hypothetical protein [Blastochloris tepida]|uniref:DUF4815 domain-containing protein n=1 Tax=Blastochloris tepida TaxID=2233851 RepID=A0A348FYH1_9HYPH|nr:hypothetical protein [Blastochloris tepida]BBF92354.1 hypothetical protein BLTE_10390 [Blastochloris tepida]
MEKQVYFRDYQEQQAADHAAIQAYARQSLDHLVSDAVTATRRYAGLTVVKTAQAEVRVDAGRFYDVGGGVYARSATTIQSMLPHLPAVAKRIVTLAATGQETDSDITERDFLVNVETGQTEPRSVAITRSRDVVLSFVAGTESADPQRPVIPVGYVAVADILLDPTQVVSITMLGDNEVASTEDLDLRTDAIETWRGQVDPRISSLASDLAALANEVRAKGGRQDLSRLYEDMARVKERVEIPDTASDYGADRFLDSDESDALNTQNLGYDCLVEEGARFADANASEAEITIFAGNDPNASLSDGLLLPRYADALKLEIGPLHSDLGIAQYGFQSHDIVQRTIARKRIRYGVTRTACTNANWWRSGTYDSATQTFRRGDETWAVLSVSTRASDGHVFYRLQQYWVDEYDDTYWDYVTVEHAITGAQVAQSFLISNDMWLTKVGLFFTSKAANEAVFLTLAEIVAGVPDLSRAILHQTVPHTAIVVGDWTEVAVQPTFLTKGKRYALVVTSAANHKIGMAEGNGYTAGTFFFSTDGQYYLGDLTKDMMLRLYGAQFGASQVTIELGALNLDGGIRAIDILAGTIEPESTELIYEVQPGGSGAWVPLTADDLTAFSAAPPLARFRARFVGTRDMHAGLKVGGSRVRLSRPKTTFRHISEPQTLAAPSSDIYVKTLLEGFDETPHDAGCRLRVGAGWETPDVTVDKAVPTGIERTYRFQLAAPTPTFSIELTGVTNSPASVFHIAERVHWAL